MAEEIDAWRVTSQLLKARGEHAEDEVQRHREHCEAGRMPERVAFWTRVEAVIRELRNVNVPARPH